MKLVTPNQVLVETLTRNLDKKTKSGILVVSDGDFRPAMHTDRVSMVIKCPSRLYFSRTPYNRRGNSTETMEWKTDMELEEGDLVWHDFMAVHNCPVITVSNKPGKEYKLINYSDIYVARRGKKVILLNGYVLCEPVKEVLGALDYREDRESFILGKVAYAGKPNQEYRSLKYSDARDVRQGDIIIRRRITRREGEDDRIFLEDPLHATFNGGKRYFIVQRKDILGKIEKTCANH